MSRYSPEIEPERANAMLVEGRSRVGVIVWLAAGAVVGLAVAAWYVLT